MVYEINNEGGFMRTILIFTATILMMLFVSCTCFPPLIPCHDDDPTPTPTRTPTQQPTPTPTPVRHTVLGIQGNEFTINGQPTFLLGVSLYGILALDTPQALSLIDYFHNKGFVYARVWVGWNRCQQNASVWNLKTSGCRMSRTGSLLFLTERIMLEW